MSDSIKAIVEEAKSAARKSPLDLCDSNIDDFMRVYAAGERASAETLAEWRKGVVHFFQSFERRVVGAEEPPVLTKEDIESFLCTVHRDDESFTRADLRRRAAVLRVAVQHLAAY